MRSAVTRAPSRSAPSRRAPAICVANRLALTRLAPVRSTSSAQAWSSVAPSSLACERFAWLSRAARKFAPDKSRPEKIEAGKALAGEIGAASGGRSLERRLHLGARHLGRRHVRRGEVEATHGVLRIGRANWRDRERKCEPCFHQPHERAFPCPDCHRLNAARRPAIVSIRSSRRQGKRSATASPAPPDAGPTIGRYRAEPASYIASATLAKRTEAAVHRIGLAQ